MRYEVADAVFVETVDATSVERGAALYCATGVKLLLNSTKTAPVEASSVLELLVAGAAELVTWACVAAPTSAYV